MNEFEIWSKIYQLERELNALQTQEWGGGGGGGYQAWVQPEMGYNYTTSAYLNMDTEPEAGLKFSHGNYTFAKGRFASPVGYTGDIKVYGVFINDNSTGDVYLDLFAGASLIGEPDLNDSYDSGNLVVTLGTGHIFYRECPVTINTDTDAAIIECQFSRLGDNILDTYADDIYFWGWFLEWI